MKKFILTIGAAALLAACSQQSTTQTVQTAQTQVSTTSTQTTGVAKYTYDTADLTDTWDASATQITLNGTSASSSSDAVTVNNGNVVISKAGTYVLSGTYTGGIQINVSTKEVVHVVLNGVTITHEKGPAIQIDQAEKVVVTVAGTNKVSDGTSYVISSDTSKTDGSAIYSRADLTFNGTGNLTVTGRYKNGIQSKDDLIFVNGAYVVTAQNDAIKGKDAVVVKTAVMTIKSGGDGIVATNTEDATKGFVLIENGEFLINAVADGIQSVTETKLVNGQFKVKTTGSTQDSSASAKGLKSDGTVHVVDGTYTLDAADDALHGKDVIVSGGQLTIDTADDGLHGDNTTQITGGTINIVQSYEGIEGGTITIAGGHTTVVSNDDALNAASNSGTGTLYITGGQLSVTSRGDGLDANGNVQMSGGTVYVYGPTSSGNGTLDYDGTFTLTGGTLVGAGSAGMAQAPSANSTQVTIATTVSQQQAGATMTVKNSSGEVIAEVKPTVAYSYVVVSTPKMKQGETYTFSVNGTQVASVQATAVVTASGVSGGRTGRR